MFLKALDIAETSSERDRLTAVTLNYLGRVYLKQGKYPEAQSAYERSMAIKEEHLEPTSPDLIEDLRGLATTYERQANPLEAEPLLERALEIAEEQDTEHPDLSNILNDLAIVYVEMK